MRQASFRLGLSFALALIYTERLAVDRALYAQGQGFRDAISTIAWVVKQHELYGCLLVSWTIMFLVVSLTRTHLRAAGLWASLKVSELSMTAKKRFATSWRLCLVGLAVLIVVVLLKPGPLWLSLRQVISSLAVHVGKGAFRTLVASGGLVALIWFTRALRPPLDAHDMREKTYEWAASNVFLYLYVLLFIVGWGVWVGPSIAHYPPDTKADIWMGLIREVAILTIIASGLVSGLPRWCAASQTVKERDRWLFFAIMWVVGIGIVVACLVFAARFEETLRSLDDPVKSAAYRDLRALYHEPWQRRLVRYHMWVRDYVLLLTLNLGGCQ